MSCDRAGRTVFKVLDALVRPAKRLVRGSVFSKRLGQLVGLRGRHFDPARKHRVANFALAGSDARGARSGVPRFTLNQAILTALRQNPDHSDYATGDRAHEGPLHSGASGSVAPNRLHWPIPGYRSTSFGRSWRTHRRSPAYSHSRQHAWILKLLQSSGTVIQRAH